MIDKIRKAASKKIVYTPHAMTQITNLERMIEPDELRKVIDTGELVENYPYDMRGNTSLILGRGTNNRPIHVVCTPTDFCLMIITAYIPSEIKWSHDFKTREKTWSV